jgi:hypothetical protein
MEIRKFQRLIGLMALSNRPRVVLQENHIAAGRYCKVGVAKLAWKER